MAKLTYKERKKMSPNSFVFSKMKNKKNPAGESAYPINDIAHGRAALQMGAKFASPSQLATIKKKVHKKFPSIGKHKFKVVKKK